MKPVIPIDLDESDMPDPRKLTREELEKVPFNKMKWVCQIKHCNGFTSIKDYGILPFFFWRKKWWSMKRSYFLCSKHWKRYKGIKIPEHYFKPRY